MGCLLRYWVAMGLLDGLATAIRFRLSSRACEGVLAGPHGIGVGVVFAGGRAGRTVPANGLAACRARSVCSAPLGRAHTRREANADGGRWPSAAIVPILLKSVGRDMRPSLGRGSHQGQHHSHYQYQRARARAPDDRSELAAVSMEQQASTIGGACNPNFDIARQITVFGFNPKVVTGSLSSPNIEG
jgi:hypothetical protein